MYHYQHISSLGQICLSVHLRQIFKSLKLKELIEFMFQKKNKQILTKYAKRLTEEFANI